MQLQLIDPRNGKRMLPLRKHNHGGYATGCRCEDCLVGIRDYLRKWRAENKDKISQYGKTHREKYPEKERERHQRYDRENREKIRETKKRYREKTPEYRESRRQYSKQYRSTAWGKMIHRLNMQA